MVKAVNFKNWCTENISPQAWNRIVLKTLPALRANGLELKTMENPDDSLMLDEPVLQVLNGALQELYQLQVEAEILS